MPRLAMMAVGALLAAPLYCEAGPQQYTIQDLGTYQAPGFVGIAWLLGAALNSSNQVAGGVAYPPGQNSAVVEHAMLWTAGSMLDLGTLGGQPSDGEAINDSGQVVGTSETSSGAGHAFLYRDGTMIDLGTLGGTASEGWGISCGGLIVGDATTASGDSHAFLYESGAMADLGTLGGSTSSARAINSAGQIVGFANTSTVITGVPPPPNGGTPYFSHAFLYSAGVMQDLGVLPGGTSTDARAINASGDVAGYGDTTTPNVYHVFLYSHGVMQDLGAPSGTMPNQGISPAMGVDSADDVVWSAGSFPYNQSSYSHGFIFRQDQGWTDLNTLLDPNDPLTPYVLITDASAINDAGVILASGYDSRAPDVPHTYLLTPAVPPAQSSASGACVNSSGSSSSSSSTSGGSASSSSSSSAPASSSSRTSASATGNSQVAYSATGASGSTGGGGDFDALSLVLLAGAVLRAVFLTRATHTRA